MVFLVGCEPVRAPSVSFPHVNSDSTARTGDNTSALLPFGLLSVRLS